MTEDAAGGSATGSDHRGSARSVLPVLAVRQSENEILAMQMERQWEKFKLFLRNLETIRLNHAVLAWWLCLPRLKYVMAELTLL